MSDKTDAKPHSVSINLQSAGVCNDSYSVYFSQYTQEDTENHIDVMWDWHSPTSKPGIRKCKRSNVQQSPKLPIKRHPSNNQINGFNKLKEDLETLRAHIVENTDIGAISSNKCTEIKNGINGTDLEDVFNDSMEEQLLVCSQEAEYECVNEKCRLKDPSFNYSDKGFHFQKQIDNKLCNPATTTTHNNNQVKDTFNTCSNSTKHNTKNNVVPNCLKYNINKIADDSFEFILETLKDEDLEFHEPVATDATARTVSYKQIKEQCTDDVLKCTAQEIELKRKEALSRLEGKKKQTAYEGESPIKCSPEEIEQKRLQAIAKLEAKKKDVIERNRQQAIKRLEENKRRRALSIQTSLPRKIHNANI